MKLVQQLSALLIALLCMTQGLSCPSEITITPLLSSKTCKFYFTVINQTCEFSKCIFQDSSSQPAYTEGWAQCFASCCGTVVGEIDINLTPYSKATQCDEIFIAKTKTLLGVSIGVSLGVVSLFIVAIGCIKYKCFLYRWCFDNRDKEVVKTKAVRKEQEIIRAVRDQQPFNPLNMTNILEQGKSQHTSQKEYIKVDEPSFKLMTYDVRSNPQLLNEKCRVCKQPKVSCFLSCNHYFHIECIGQWLLEERCCASCGNQKIKYIHLFCSECRVKLKVQQIHKFRSSFRKKLAFRCGECQDRR